MPKHATKHDEINEQYENYDQNWLNGCSFRPAGVICTRKNCCAKCGWNPDVESERKKRIRAERANNQGTKYCFSVNADQHRDNQKQDGK